MSGLTRDPFARFRPATPARIGLGRSGDAQPTSRQLDFQMAHALARDAVHGRVDWDAVAAALPCPSVRVRSAAPDRATYLRRPDLGRRLDPACHDALKPGAGNGAIRDGAVWDVAIIVADGLSSAAVQRWGVPVVEALLPRLGGLRVAPVVLAEQARVALGDPIGERLGARLAALLVGERPGLSVADSLGIYLTYAPRPGRRDSERNCISNIHADGLSPAAAADKAAWLITEALRRQLTGIGLKDETPPPTLSGEHPPVPAGDNP